MRVLTIDCATPRSPEMTNSKPSLTAMAKALESPQSEVMKEAAADAPGVDAFSPAIMKAGEMPDMPENLKRNEKPETLKERRARLAAKSQERVIKNPPKTTTTKPAALTPAKEETTKMPTSKTTKSSARTSVKAKTTATDQPTKAQKAAAVIKADPEASAAVKTARRKAKAAPAPAPAKTAPAAKAPAKAKAVKLPAGKSKSDVVEEMLRSPKGATRKELSEASGWPYVNLKMAAIRAGMELVQKGDHFRLVKTRGEANAAA